MKKSILIGIALLLGTFAGCSDWAGFGFDASGPEMPRLRQIMLLKSGMTVADVGAGKGELAFALARDVGPTGRVYANDVNLERLALCGQKSRKEISPMSLLWKPSPAKQGCPLPAATPSYCGGCITI